MIYGLSQLSRLRACIAVLRETRRAQGSLDRSLCPLCRYERHPRFVHRIRSISRVSKALITRAKPEMDIRLEQAAQSLSSFFEEDFDFLKLDPPSRNHLERYRSFLHSYHIRKFGFWPPRAVYTEGSSFSKSVIQSMYFDFRKLYEYLADTESFVLKKGQ